MSEKFFALVSVLLTAFVYWTGFAYLDGYYEFHDVSVRELELGLPDVLVHSVVPYRRQLAEIFSGFSLLLILCALAIASAATLHNRRRLRRNIARYIRIGGTVAAILVAAFLLSAVLNAHRYGDEVARSELDDLNRVMLIDERNSLKLGDFTERRSPRVLLTHLTTTPETFYVVARFEGEIRRWVLRVPRMGSVHMRVYQQSY